MAVRWYLRYGLSYRDVEELLAERGISVDHVSVYRWVQTFTAEFIDAARPARHAAGDRWFVDETYVKVAGRWSYLYRAVDQHGQVVDVFVSMRRNAAAARVFFTSALRYGRVPVEVTTDRAPAYQQVIGDAARAARHVTERYANNAMEADHGRASADARTQTPYLSRHCRGWARVRAEPAPRPLRHHCRRADPGSNPRRVRRPCPVPLTELQAACPGPACSSPDQRNSAAGVTRRCVGRSSDVAACGLRGRAVAADGAGALALLADVISE
jgi:transposase-like protein